MHDRDSPALGARDRQEWTDSDGDRPCSPSSAAFHAPIPILPAYYPDEGGRKRFVRQLFDRTAADYEHVERIAGLGAGAWYRGDALKRAGLGRGMTVLDVGAGTGLTTRAAVGLTGDAASVVASDPSIEMLREARQTHGIGLVQASAEKLPYRAGEFDFLSMGYALRHLADVRVAFSEFFRVLKPGGTVCVLEISRPESRLAGMALGFYIKTLVPLLARLTRRQSEPDLLMRFYWDTIDACIPPSRIMAVLAEAGFERVERLTHWGILSEYLGRKPVSTRSV